MSALAAAVAAGLAVGWALPEAGDRLHRLADEPDALRVARSRRLARAVAGLVVGLLLLGAVGGGRGVALGLAAVEAVGAGTLLVTRAAARRLRARRARDVATAGQVLAGMMRAGQVPAAALASAATECPVLAEAQAELAVGGDVPRALGRSAQVPGRGGLSHLGAAWAIGARTGASLVDTLEVTADLLADEDETARVVPAELAAPRATVGVMAGLPGVGLALGYSFGGDPVAFLTGSLLGQACLVVGVGLASAGLLWGDAVAARAGGR